MFYKKKIIFRKDEFSLDGLQCLDRERHIGVGYLGQVKLVMEKPCPIEGVRRLLLFFRKMTKLVLTSAKMALCSYATEH